MFKAIFVLIGLFVVAALATVVASAVLAVLARW